MFKRKKKEDQQNTEQPETVDSILSKIKSVVSGKENVKIDDDDVTKKRKNNKTPEIIEDEEPLELTEMVGDENEQTTDGEEPIASVLEDILKTLEPEISKQEEQSTTENESILTPSEEKPAEEDFVDVLKEIDKEFDENTDKNQEITENITIAETNIEITNAEESFDLEKELEENIIEPVAEPKKPEEIIVKQPQTPVVMEEAKENIVKTEAASKLNDGLVSDDTISKSSSAIKSLMDSIPRPKIDSPMFKNGISLEDIVLDAMKPMLKEWLDKNLDIIVRDIVQKEIRKIIPRD